MSNPKCTRCKGKLKARNKTINAIDPKDNYTQIVVILHACVDCEHELYVKAKMGESE